MEKLSIIGHIGQSAETKKVNGGDEFMQFSVACNRSYKDATGEKKTATTWYSVTAKPSAVKDYLTKGVQVYVSGTPSNNLWQNKDGITQIGHRLRAFDIQLLGKKEEGKDGI